MSTVIRAADPNMGTSGVAFNFDDMADQAKGYLDRVRAEAVKIVAKAQQEADGVRRRAEAEGRQAALQAVERIVEKQLATVLPALRQAVADIVHAKQAWLTHWEAGGVHVAAAIAKRLIRGELSRQPDITLKLVREALELAAGSSQIRIHLHPDDQRALGGQVQLLIQAMSGLGDRRGDRRCGRNPRRLPRGNPLRHHRSATRVPIGADRRGIDRAAAAA